MRAAIHSNSMIAMVMLELVLLFCPALVVHRSFGIKVAVSIFTLFEKVLYVTGCLCVIVPRR